MIVRRLIPLQIVNDLHSYLLNFLHLPNSAGGSAVGAAVGAAVVDSPPISYF